MEHKSKSFKKICRIITSLFGIGDSIFLIFSYADKYWLTFFGYRHLIFSIFFLLFSTGTFVSAILVYILSKKHFKFLDYIFSFLCAIDFFFALSLLYLSSFKTKDETYYWISVYSNTHENQQIILDFNIDYPPNKIDSYIRYHTIYVHDIILLTILVWLVFFILYTFYPRQIIKYLFGKKGHKEIHFNSNGSELIESIENEYDYEYDSTYNSETENNKPQDFKRHKLGHVKSADKILHLVNIDDKEAIQSPSSTKKKADTSTNNDDNTHDIKDNNEKDQNKSTSSLVNSPNTLPNKESDRSSKPPQKRRRRKSQRDIKKPNQNNSNQKKTKNDDDISETVVVSISPTATNSSTSQKPKYNIPKHNFRTPKIDISDDSAPHKKYPRVKYDWKKTVNLSISSSSDSITPPPFFDRDDTISSVLLYDSDDSLSFFGFDYSDSW